MQELEVQDGGEKHGYIGRNSGNIGLVLQVVQHGPPPPPSTQRTPLRIQYMSHFQLKELMVTIEATWSFKSREARVLKLRDGSMVSCIALQIWSNA
jgi:hypothetical protein